MEKIYIGSAKAIPTKYGEVMTLSFSPKDLEKLKENINDKGWINLNISERKEVGKYGETHSVTVNNWKPERESGTQEKQSGTQEIRSHIPDIPF